MLHITKFRPRTLPPYTCPHDGKDRTLRIIAAGLGRSGSTWQFNVLIVLLKMAGFDVASSHGQLDDKFAVMNRSMHCNVAVIKVHQFHPLLLARADYVFTSHRDPRDAVMSLIDLGVGLFWAQYWAEYQRWSAFACYDMAYESMWADPGAEVRRMAAVLGLQDVIDSTVRACVSACVWCVVCTVSQCACPLRRDNKRPCAWLCVSVECWAGLSSLRFTLRASTCTSPRLCRSSLTRSLICRRCCNVWRSDMPPVGFRTSRSGTAARGTTSIT